MKTIELLNASEAELVPQLRDMKLKELERHAAKLLKKLNADYATVLAAVTRAVPDLAKTENAFARIQQVIREHSGGNSSEKNDVQDEQHIVERAAVIMIVLIKKQFLKIHERS